MTAPPSVASVVAEGCATESPADPRANPRAHTTWIEQVSGPVDTRRLNVRYTPGMDRNLPHSPVDFGALISDVRAAAQRRDRSQALAARDEIELRRRMEVLTTATSVYGTREVSEAVDALRAKLRDNRRSPRRSVDADQLVLPARGAVRPSPLNRDLEAMRRARDRERSEGGAAPAPAGPAAAAVAPDGVAVFPWASTREAVLDVLRADPQRSFSVNEIMTVLRDHGWEADSNKPDTVVRAALSRLYRNKEVARPKSGRYQIAEPGRGVAIE